MKINELANKLEQNDFDFELIEESLNYPVLCFNKKSNQFKFFYRENYIQRTKFHKRYKTFLEITANDESEIEFLKLKIEKMLSCRYCIDEHKIYINITKIQESEIIDFINKLEK